MPELQEIKKTNPELGFLIVNWNRAPLLKRCLESLHRHVVPPFETVVVDNASQDGSPEMVRSFFPSVHVIENPENLGFAKANNIGIRYLQERDLLPTVLVFLNNDAVLEDDSLLELVKILNRTEAAVAALPSVYLEKDKLQTGVAGFELTLGTAFNYFFGLSILFPRVCRGLFLHQEYFRRRRQVCRVDWISGVCLVLKTPALQHVPGFPEDYFMYAEDLAFCRELRKQGRIFYYPDSRIYHLRDVSANSNQETMWLDALFQYYRSLNQSKGAALKLWLLKVIFMKGFALRYLGYSLASVFDAERTAQARNMKTYLGHTWKKLFSA
jgi:GT2 family glycosyltransferase